MPRPNDGSRSQRRGSARELAGKALRRGVRGLDAAQARLLNEPSAVAREPGPAAKNAQRRGPGGDALTVARAGFFESLEHDGDFGRAALATVRAFLATGAGRRARTFGQILQLQPGTQALGDICMAVIAARTEMPDTAWRLFARVDKAQVLQLAPAEYLRVALALQPETGVETLAAISRGELTADADAAGWLDIACTSFAAGAEQLSRYAAEQARARLSDGPASRAVRAQLRWLEPWYGRSGAAAEPADGGALPLAVTGFRQPDRAGTTRDLGPYFETLAALTQLARRTGVRFTGDADLVEFADALRERIPAQRRIAGDDATVRLYEVDRDAARYAAVPDGTWLILCGLLPRAMFDMPVATPGNPRLRPIFLSVHIDAAAVLTTQMIDYLRRYGPVGCRDWSTVLLLQAADVPAFFAGPVTATLGDLDGGSAPGGGALFVDVDGAGSGETATQEFDAVRTRGLVENLRDAADRVAGFRGRRVTTSRLQTYLAARAAGARAELRPAIAAERRFDGLLGVDDATFGALRDNVGEKLATVYGAILSGDSEDAVYARWREVCAADLVRAAEERDRLPPLDPPAFDIAGACATIRAASVVVERSRPGPDGAEINVELSLDGNYKPQLEVVLDSIVTHSSRPIRAFVLCRDHTQDDYDRMAALFPTVSFVWLPTDSVDYGPISGMLGYTTVATMDRLLLPDLLPEIDRIIHHDLDALCLADLAELYDVDLKGTPIAARTSPQPNIVSGFNAFMRQSERFFRRPHLGPEYRRRTHRRHRFDFQLLNAGILVLDLAAMRADDFCRNFLPYVERFGMNDQAVLNIYAGGNRVELEAGWNWRPWLEELDEPKIAHWAGDFKPWKPAWVFGRDLWRAGEARVAQRYETAGLR